MTRIKVKTPIERKKRIKVKVDKKAGMTYEPLSSEMRAKTEEAKKVIESFKPKARK